MKKPDLSNWRNPDTLCGLLFFAQVVEEMLFDHTLDSYRVPALNSHFIVREFTIVSADVQRGEIRPASLTPVAEEMATHIRSCPVMQEILKPDLEWHLDAVAKAGKHLRVAREHARRILDIVGSRYLNELTAQLKRVVLDGQKKERITTLARCWVCELINRGYSAKHLYFACQRHFFGRRRIDSIRVLNTFLDAFDFKTRKFRVVFRGSSTFRLTHPYSNVANIRVSEEAPDAATSHPKEREWLKKPRQNGTRFLETTVEELDPNSAANTATENIRILSDLTTWHIHRQKLNWEEEALVISEDGTIVETVKPPKLSVHKRPDVQEGRLSDVVKRIANTVIEHKLSERSIQSVVRSLRMHADAVRSDQATTQFVYLWTMVETLAPRDYSKARINVFLEFMLPYLCMGYAVKLLHDLGKNLEAQDRNTYLEILHSAPAGDSRVEKLAAILALPSQADKRDKLLAMCNGNPLLRYRTFRVSETLSSPKDTQRMLRRHEVRVKQHLQRMYRVRNMILHSGVTMPYLSTLVENLHDYIDRIVDKIIRECDPFPVAHRDIDAVTVSVRDRYSSHLDALEKAKVKDEELTPDNFQSLILGS